MSFYYFACMITLAVTVRDGNAVFGCALYLGVSIYSVYLTYKESVKTALIIYYLTTIAWVILCCAAFGFTGRIDIFLIIVIMVIYTTNYLPTFTKFLISLGVFLLERCIYFYQLLHDPLYVPPVVVVEALEISTIVIEFVCITIILAIFSSDTMKTEAKLAKYNEKLHKLAGQDPLTKLPNRRSVLEYMKTCIASCDQHYAGMCVAMGDIDFFKKVNDTYGHDAGDEVLKSLAGLFMENMKNRGMVARWGGEEFLFVYENMNLDDAAVFMEEMLRKVREIHVLYGGNDITFTMTFGITDVDIRIDKNKNDDEITDNINSAVGEADQKLYYGKKNGRNKVVV